MRPSILVAGGLAVAAVAAVLLLSDPSDPTPGPDAAVAGPLLDAADRQALTQPGPAGPTPGSPASNSAAPVDPTPGDPAPGDPAAGSTAAGGAAAGPAGPGSAGPAAVDPADPIAVVTAYLTAACAAVPEDAQGPHRRGAEWAEPGSVPERVGVVVLDPPPPGTVRTAQVTAVEVAAADPGDTRRRYTAEVVTTQQGVASTARFDVLVVRTADGRWLVRSAAPAAPTGADE